MNVIIHPGNYTGKYPAGTHPFMDLTGVLASGGRSSPGGDAVLIEGDGGDAAMIENAGRASQCTASPIAHTPAWGCRSTWVGMPFYQEKDHRTHWCPHH
ncbi:MAG: hypothetical protein U9R58_15745 [Chloroflexota bacterium]|nr:hypothetical protein [Chloroflexota bacterium]